MDRFLSGVFICLFSFGGPAPAFAQFDLSKKEVKNDPELTPTALAVSLAFSSSTWLAVAVSTSAPHLEMAKLLHKKRYRLELIQMILLAEASGKTLNYVDARHEKKTTLRALAGEFKVDFDALYDRAIEKLRVVERRVEDVSRVRAGPEEGMK